jgi:hypothetical protein
MAGLQLAIPPRLSFRDRINEDTPLLRARGNARDRRRPHDGNPPVALCRKRPALRWANHTAERGSVGHLGARLLPAGCWAIAAGMRRGPYQVVSAPRDGTRIEVRRKARESPVAYSAKQTQHRPGRPRPAHDAVCDGVAGGQRLRFGSVRKFRFEQ